MTAIEHGLAVVMAGQVGVGLTPGDEQAERAQAALTAIGLMLLNATDRDPKVLEAIVSSERASITREPDGSLTIRMSLPSDEGGIPPDYADSAE